MVELTRVALNDTIKTVWLLSGVATVIGLNNGLGQTPIMGYNTWNDFRCDNVSAANIEKVATAIIELGLHRAGYRYVNIDDCWAVKRDAEGVIVEDAEAFPNGMKSVGDYLHARGLKLGLYTDRGTATCEGRPGSEGYEELDAQTYAQWGADYLKEDSCNAPSDHEAAFEQYRLMRDALNRTGRPIYFALCGWSSWYAPVGKGLANSWRVGYDVNTWENVWYNAIVVNERLAQYAGPGGFNDVDALIGSTPGGAVSLTTTQSRTQFSLWSMMSAPLIIGSNMLHLTTFDLETYTNGEVVAVNQDPLGMQGTVVWQNCPSTDLSRDQSVENAPVPNCQQIWAKKLFDGYAVMFVNFTSTSAASAPWTTHRPPEGKALEALELDVQAVFGWEAANARDLWTHMNLGIHRRLVVVLSGGNGESKVLKLTKPALEVKV